MTERTLAERLRAIAEPRFSPLFPEEVTALREAAAALERLGELEDDPLPRYRTHWHDLRDDARAALNHAAPAAGEREREPDATYRKALENALIHTAHLPHASRDLLEGLLASVARICKEALGIDTARTPEPAGDSEPTAAILCEIADEFDRSPEPWENERAVRVRKAAAALERLEALEAGLHDASQMILSLRLAFDRGDSRYDECIEAAAKFDELATPAPAPQQGGEDD